MSKANTMQSPIESAAKFAVSQSAFTMKSVKELFGIESKIELPAFNTPARYKATPIPHYVFRKELMRDLLIFWQLGKRSCMLTGHKGSGKTSLVDQFHLKLNVNCQTINGNGRTSVEALFGQYFPTESGGLQWHDGVVTSAARNGWSVVINEFNAIPEDIQLALMDAAHDGAPINIDERGEQLQPAEGFRMFFTINPKGGNDFMYRGRKELDAALKERMFWISVGYADRKDEERIVQATWDSLEVMPSDVSRDLTEKMVNVACAVRDSSASGGAGAIPEVISTRVLCNWALYWAQYVNEPGSVHMALQRALTYGCRPEVAAAIHHQVNTEFNVPSPYETSPLLA